MSASHAQVDNGINVQALIEPRIALTDAPAGAQFQWRATCTWKKGTHSHATVKGFFGLGDEQRHKTSFSFDADHPEAFASEDYGATPVDLRGSQWVQRVKVTQDIGADAPRDEIKALVAQSQKRSAVYNIITNPTNVTVDV